MGWLTDRYYAWVESHDDTWLSNHGYPTREDGINQLTPEDEKGFQAWFAEREHAKVTQREPIGGKEPAWFVEEREDPAKNIAEVRATIAETLRTARDEIRDIRRDAHKHIDSRTPLRAQEFSREPGYGRSLGYDGDDDIRKPTGWNHGASTQEAVNAQIQLDRHAAAEERTQHARNGIAQLIARQAAQHQDEPRHQHTKDRGHDGYDR